MGKKTTEEKIKEIAKGVTDAAQPYIRDVKAVAKPYVDKAEPYISEIRSKAEPVVNDLKTKTEPVVSDIINKAEPVYEDVKSNIINKAEPVIEKIKKTAGPAADKALTVGKDISSKAVKHKCKEEIFIQYNNHELRAQDIIEKAKQDFVGKGNNLTDIKEIQVYLKPSDNAAYYVVNHSETGKVEF